MKNKIALLLGLLGPFTLCTKESDMPEYEPSAGTDPDTPIIVDTSNFRDTSLAPFYFTLDTEEKQSLLVSASGERSYECTVTGADPFILSLALEEDLDAAYQVIEFEYLASEGISGENGLQLFYAIGGIPTEANSKKYGDLPSDTDYKTFSADIWQFRYAGWGKRGDKLRIDPGGTPGQSFTLKNICLRERTAAEELAARDNLDSETAKQLMAQNLSVYLSKTYSSSITKVTVTSSMVTIEGSVGSSGNYLLADICPWQDVTEMTTFPYTETITEPNFKISVYRTVNNREGINYDRLFSKWAVVKVEGDIQTLDSHARYADEVPAKASPSETVLKNKKGLGAGSSDLYFSDFDALDIGSITMNLPINEVIDATGSDYSYGGITYRIGGGPNNYDKIIAQAAKRSIVVSAIILCPVVSPYKHPECTGTSYSMPNLTEAESFNMYAAAIDYLANRYCSNDPGRIHNWIMHNEVDAASEWTDMGTQPMLRYVDSYIKSMRVCYNIVRQYDQNASVLGSFTHCWAKADVDYAPKEMLEEIVAYSEAEGDFRWGVACHPYPQDLTKPEFWKNDVSSATYSMDSQYCTLLNLEVIDHWIKEKNHLYKDGTKRLLFLSEQGTNSPTYSDSDLALQAAGAAWAWKKTSRLDGIDAFQWHNWADNVAEGGLRIGLRSFADGSWADMTAKPSWYVWRDAGTDNESGTLDQYLSTIGVNGWDDIMGTVE